MTLGNDLSETWWLKNNQIEKKNWGSEYDGMCPILTNYVLYMTLNEGAMGFTMFFLPTTRKFGFLVGSGDLLSYICLFHWLFLFRPLRSKKKTQVLDKIFTYISNHGE